MEATAASATRATHISLSYGVHRDALNLSIDYNVRMVARNIYEQRYFDCPNDNGDSIIAGRMEGVSEWVLEGQSWGRDFLWRSTLQSEQAMGERGSHLTSNLLCRVSKPWVSEDLIQRQAYSAE